MPAQGREDLHLDARIMQLLRTVNGLLRADRAVRAASPTGLMHGSAGLRARHYAVLPLSERSGLIRWVEGVTPLYSLYEARLSHAAAQAAPREGGRPQAASPPETPRPADTFYAKLTPALHKAGVPAGAPRRAWPHGVLRSVLLELMRETPRDLIAHELWGRAANAAAGWASSRAYAASAATNSMVGYVVGLGDRHLDNVLLDLSSGELLHIDYNVCFEKGLRLKVAETVPFRMTPAMVSALGPWGVDGPLCRPALLPTGYSGVVTRAIWP